MSEIQLSLLKDRRLAYEKATANATYISMIASVASCHDPSLQKPTV